MNTILSYIQKVPEERTREEKITYLVHIPPTIIKALKQRGNIPDPPYVRWMHYSHDKFYYIVTLGSAKGSMKNPLLKGNVTELPKEIVDSIRSETTPLEANAILWDVVTWKEKPVARARILFGYGEKLQNLLVFAYIRFPREIKDYMLLCSRTKLYWEQLDKNTWLISKDQKDHDAISWHAWDFIKIPSKVLTQIGFYTEERDEIELTLKDGKPALLLRVYVTKTRSLDNFLTNFLEANGESVEIHYLLGKYLLSLPETEDEPAHLCDLAFKLYNFSIISHDDYKKICKHRDRPFYIHGYSLKTQINERGDDNG